VTLPRVAISLGDPSGIGPEVTAAALADRRVARALVPVVFGDARLFARAAKTMGVADGLSKADPGSKRGWLVGGLGGEKSRPGRPDREGALAQLAYLDAAASSLEEGLCTALCTAPLSKSQVISAAPRLHFTGHTEYLAQRFKSRVLMMLAGSRLRVVLATTHLPLARVPKAITRKGLAADLALLSRELERAGISRPRIAVAGLNPHAGEQGHLGTEDERIIRPAIAEARRAGVKAEGPFAADSLFPRAVDGGYDAVMAMYHDQGLVALKLLHFRDGVNVTLGLPFVRTSPDHGVAYDRAGKGTADPESMIQALLWAAGRPPPPSLKRTIIPADGR
jgi:4-hydroxythreonine-4-phosphate dehydrogenase